MSFSHEYTPIGDEVAKALKENEWKFSESSSLFPRPEVVSLSKEERIKSVAALMHDCGDLLRQLPYISEEVDKDNGVIRAPSFKKIRIVGETSHVFLSFTRFDTYDANFEANRAGAETQFTLVAGIKRNNNAPALTEQPLSLQDPFQEEVMNRYSYYFSSSGIACATFTPGISQANVENKSVVMPIPYTISNQTIDAARDAMWYVYQKMVVVHSKA